jgi:siroheme synthase (precorrin-2 oxidase/ferrochelatase)
MCRRRGILFNAASDESLCDFCFPGIVRRDPLVIGVSASGEDHELEAKATKYLKGIFEKK